MSIFKDIAEIRYMATKLNAEKGLLVCLSKDQLLELADEMSALRMLGVDCAMLANGIRTAPIMVCGLNIMNKDTASITDDGICRCKPLIHIMSYDRDSCGSNCRYNEQGYLMKILNERSGV